MLATAGPARGDEVRAVRASVATAHDDSPCPDVALVDLHFSGGTLGSIEALRGAEYAYDIRTELVCEEGALLIGSFATAPLVVLRPGGTPAGTYPGFIERYADAYAAEVDDFVSGVAERRPPAVTGEDGRLALAIALAADRAAAEGREGVL